MSESNKPQENAKQNANQWCLLVFIVLAMNLIATVSVMYVIKSNSETKKDGINPMHFELPSSMAHDQFYSSAFSVLVKMHIDQNAKVENIFHGPAGTFVGEIKTPNKSYQVVMLPDGKSIVVGKMLSFFDMPNPEQTANQSTAIEKLDVPAMEERVAKQTTAQLMNEVKKKQEFAGASLQKNSRVVNKDEIYAIAEQSQYVAYGNGSKVLYIYHDANCPHCKKVYDHLVSTIDTKLYQLRFLPVGVLGPDSNNKAAYILGSNSMETRLERLKAMVPSEKFESAVPSPIESEMKQGLKRSGIHYMSLAKTGKVGTPTFLFQTDTGPIMAQLKSRSQLDALLTQIVGG